MLRGLSAFVVESCSRQQRDSAKKSVTALRSLLRLLHVEGAISRSF
jgi:hypothetical protein